MAQPRSESAVDPLQRPGEDRQKTLVSEREERDLARRSRGEVVRVEEGQSADQRTGAAIGQARPALHDGDHVGGRAEGVYVASAAPEPAVDLIRQGGGVGD